MDVRPGRGRVRKDQRPPQAVDVPISIHRIAALAAQHTNAVKVVEDSFGDRTTVMDVDDAGADVTLQAASVRSQFLKCHSAQAILLIGPHNRVVGHTRNSYLNNFWVEGHTHTLRVNGAVIDGVIHLQCFCAAFTPQLSADAEELCWARRKLLEKDIDNAIDVQRASAITWNTVNEFN